jgi:hypothetical protein
MSGEDAMGWPLAVIQGEEDLHPVKAPIQVDEPVLQLICETFERLADRARAAGGKPGKRRSVAVY